MKMYLELEYACKSPIKKKDHLKNIIKESLVWGSFEISSLTAFLAFILAHFEHLTMVINYIFSLTIPGISLI